MNKVLELQAVACPDEGSLWSFYLLNRGDRPLRQIVLEKVEEEWGAVGDVQRPNFSFDSLAPGESLLLTQLVDEELRFTLHISANIEEERFTFQFAFPMLYSRKDQLQEVPLLKRAGVVAETRGR